MNWANVVNWARIPEVASSISELLEFIFGYNQLELPLLFHSIYFFPIDVIMDFRDFSEVYTFCNCRCTELFIFGMLLAIIFSKLMRKLIPALVIFHNLNWSFDFFNLYSGKIYFWKQFLLGILLKLRFRQSYQSNRDTIFIIKLLKSRTHPFREEYQLLFYHMISWSLSEPLTQIF